MGNRTIPEGITYEKRTSIKSQILPEFCSEWTELDAPGPPDLSSSWTMYFDGSKRETGAGAGVILVSLQGDRMRYVLRMSFLNATKNEAEYEGLLHGMRMAKACGATRLKIHGDFNLVVKQTMNLCNVTKENMVAYRNLYNVLEGNFEGCELVHIGGESNSEADTLANIGSRCLPIPPCVFWEEISEPSIKTKKKKPKPGEVKGSGAEPTEQSAAADDEDGPAEVMMIEPTWTQPYIAYLAQGKLPDEPIEARRIARRAKAYTIINGELYKRSITGVLQRCIAPEQGIAILREIHEGICGHHASSRAIAAKAFRTGFFWLTAIQDAKDIVRTCNACQRFATRPHALAAELNPIPLAWPFAQWGLDMVGKLPKSSPGGHVYLLVAVDKFTKWIEATPVTTQDGTAAVNFIKSIVFRFGVPNSIITDNGTNFTSVEFKGFCEDLGIQLKFASVAHRRPTVRWKRPTASSAQDSRRGSFTPSSVQEELGWMSCHQCYGAYAQRQILLRSTRHTSWCTEQRLYYQSKCASMLSVSLNRTKTRLTQPSRTASTHSKKHAISHSRTPRPTSRVYATIMVAGFAPGPSTLETWFSGLSRKEPRSCSHPGKDPTSSRK